MTRTVVGLGLGSGREAVDAVAVRIVGVGLAMLARPAGHARVPVPADVRDALASQSRTAPRLLAELLALAANRAAGGDPRTPLAAGFLSRDPVDPADALAETTGLTVASQFAGRDKATRGTGDPVTAAADALLYASSTEERLLIHLGAVTSVVLVPAGGKLSQVTAFTVGPGHRLLDDIVSLGTRRRVGSDPGGTRAVQGKCLDSLLTGWLRLHRLMVRPPRSVQSHHFGDSFLADAFDQARAANGTLHDLLCTATHFVARAAGEGCDRWLPAPAAPRTAHVSGGGGRNGFLRQLLANQFAAPRPLDELGVPATARTAAAAAVLAALLLDGVPANLPLSTGATGGRLLGRLTPGDGRNWARVKSWLADPLAGSAVTARLAG